MNRIKKIEGWLKYVSAARMLQEAVLFAASLISLIRDRSDLACYFLVLSFWIGAQLGQFQKMLSERYNRLLDEQERRNAL